MDRGTGEIGWTDGNETCDIPGCEIRAHSILVVGEMKVQARCPIHCGEMTMKVLKERWERRMNRP